MPTKGTTPRQFRFSDDDMTLIDHLAAHFGHPSRASLLRYAVQRLAKSEFGQDFRLPEPPKPEAKKRTRKKIPKKGK